MTTTAAVLGLLALAALLVLAGEVARHRAELARRATATETLTALAALEQYARPARSAAVRHRLDLDAAIARHPSAHPALHPAAAPTVLARRAPAVLRLADRLNDPAR